MTPLAADPTLAAQYRRAGWWGDQTLAGLVSQHATRAGERIAFVDEHDDAMSWRRYDELSGQIGVALASAGLRRGDVVAVLLPDGPAVHAAFLGAEKAGVVVMGIGHRAGDAEVDHLVGKARARAIVTGPTHRAEDSRALVRRLRDRRPGLEHHVVLEGPTGAASVSLDGQPVAPPGREGAAAELAGRAVGPDELFLLNSTSGTTGLPKCVVQFQNRWFYFHRRAVEFGHLGAEDVFMSVVPAPFGFGLWTSHFTPTILGACCVVMRRFEPAEMIRLIERHRVSVLAAVSTQFVMMLNSPELQHHDLGSLRVLFTGGEAIPYRRAVEFEDRTGCTVLNFYGSNETGLLSGTTIHDPPERRFRTGGRCVEEMQVRLYEPGGTRISGDQGRGQPACRGPATTLGYYEDDAANRQLFTEDGWMLMGDIVEIDEEGYLTVVGRTSDFIIRGGKNISAPAVEAEVATHPSVAIAAAVPAPDPVFGERVAAYVELRPGRTLDLEQLRAHLEVRGVSREWFPEHLVLMEELPRASGGKVAKGELRQDAAARFGGRDRS